MFTYEEIIEMDHLCKEDERFAKYIERFREENDSLLSNAAHEIGNTVTLIYSTMQLMEEREPAVKDMKYWGQMKEDVESLALLVRETADYSHCGSLVIGNENIIEIVESSASSFQPVLNERGITLVIENPNYEIEHIAKNYACDGVKIRQVIVNILKNAAEAIREKGTIWIRYRMNKEDNRLLLEVENNGKRMSQEELKNIFIQDISYKKEGHGIGMAASSRIMRAHGGEITAESTTGKTKISVCFPL